MTFSDAQDRREKFFSGDKIEKSAESDNSDLFKDLIWGESAGNSWLKAGTAPRLQHHQAHQMPPPSLMTERVMFSSPGEWWSSPLPPSGRPGIPQNQHLSEIQSHGSSSARCSTLPFLRPSDREGATALPVTEQLTLLSQQTCPGPVTRTPVPHPPGEPGSPCRQEPPAELGASGAQGARGGPRSSEEPLFWGQTAQGSFAVVSLRTWYLHLPLLPSSASWEEVLPRAVYTDTCLCCHWGLEIWACCGMFSDSGLFLGKKTNLGKGERHLHSGQ